MTRRPAVFRQIDLTRALRAARAAGLNVGEVAIDADGRIVIKSAAATPPEPALTPLQQWRQDRARTAQGT